jgi:hypothetical protein
MRRTILPFALGWLIGMAAVLSAAFGQTLSIEPAVAKTGQAIVGTVKDLPPLPDGATDEQVTVSVEGGEALNCGLGKIHFWAPPGKHQATWKRTARVPGRTEISFIPGPKFDIKAPRFEDLIPQERVIPEATIEQSAAATVEVEGAPQPVPPGPTPPTPDDKPPIPEPGLHVLMIYESQQPTPEPQLQSLYSTAIRSYVIEHGGQWRMYDKDALPEVAWAANAMKRQRTGVPWWIYSNGKRGGEGPLPDEQTALATLKGLEAAR